MDTEEMNEFLGGQKSVQDTLDWLRKKYLPRVQENFNSEDSRKRIALYQGETIPQNERNLTDVRTRMGILIEFELTRISNDLLKQNEIDSLYWTYVVANRFPDLEVRDRTGARKLRLEIKTLQCIAEEKSANFNTLIKDIHPETDYLIVCLWDWNIEKSSNYNWDSAPFIHNIYVFSAYHLAKLRDFYWLNNPPKDLGNSIQGFDARFAVTGKDSIFSKEQGNYGKLMRLWKEDFQYIPPTSSLMKDTIKNYVEFQQEVLWLGFKILADSQCNYMYPDREVTEICEKGKIVGYKSLDFACILASRIDKSSPIKKMNEFMINHKLNTLVKFTDKYRVTIYLMQEGKVVIIVKDIKPKNIPNYLP